jgi:hypothetical protein
MPFAEHGVDPAVCATVEELIRWSITARHGACYCAGEMDTTHTYWCPRVPEASNGMRCQACISRVGEVVVYGYGIFICPAHLSNWECFRCGKKDLDLMIRHGSRTMVCPRCYDLIESDLSTMI